MGLTAALGGSLFGWIFVGVAIYAYLAYSDYSVTQPEQAAFSDPGIGGGPWQPPVSSQTPVSVVFGTARVPLPLAHYRLEGDQYRDMWLVACAGEDWSSLWPAEGEDPGYKTIVGDIWVNDYKLSELSAYTNQAGLFDRDHTWARLHEHGTGISLAWSSKGKHAFVKKVEVGNIEETYPLQVAHDAGVGGGTVHLKIRLIHQFQAGGTKQRFNLRVFYINEGGSSWTLRSDSSETFCHKTQTVQAGKDTETVEVAGTSDSTYEMDMPTQGTFKVSLELVSATNDGSLYLDSVELSDTALQSETVSSYGSSLVVLRVLDKTGDIGRPQLTAMVTGGPSNPALALLWILTDGELGIGGNLSDGSVYAGRHIDETSFILAADKCDQYGYVFNRGFYSLSDYENVIPEICACGRLQLAEWNGWITCIFDEEVPSEDVRVINLSNDTAGDVEYGAVSLARVPNSFKIKYVDPQMDYTVQDLTYDDIEKQQVTGVVNEQNIGLFGVTDQNKAWELGWYHAKWAQSDMWIHIPLAPRLWDLAPGSIIKVTDDSDPFINGKEFKVVSIEEGDNYSYLLRGVGYVRGAYTPPEWTEWHPEIFLETPGVGSSQYDAPSGGIVFSDVITEPTANMTTRITMLFSGIPENAETVKIYRSYDNNGYTLISEIKPAGNTATFQYLEQGQWTWVYFKAVVQASGKTTPLEGAPMTQTYVIGSEESLPGYGLGGYGYQPYGG